MALAFATLVGCREPDLVVQGADEVITVKVLVVSYDADAVHSTATTPDGVTYHPDMYDAAYCRVVAVKTDLPDPFVIWGWNRTQYVPESLRVADASATITFKRSAIEDSPFGDGTRGIISTAILKIAN